MTKNHPLARAGSAGHSPRLAKSSRGEPRTRLNAAALVGDADHGPGLQRDGKGRTRVSALDGLAPLKLDGVSLEDVAHRLNLILQRLQQ